MWKTVLEVTNCDNFDTQRHWANGFMGILKANNGKWADLTSCVDYASYLEARLEVCPVEYLDEVGRVAMQNCSVYREISASKPSMLTTGRKQPKVQTFLDFAVCYGLASYVSVKAPTMTGDGVKHAAQFRGQTLPKSATYFSGLVRGHSLRDSAQCEEALHSVLHFHEKEYRKMHGKNKWRRVKKRLFGWCVDILTP